MEGQFANQTMHYCLFDFTPINIFSSRSVQFIDILPLCPFISSPLITFMVSPLVTPISRHTELQAAAYQPFFRSHAHHDSKRREPWVFGDPWTERIRSTVMDRYSLLPYWWGIKGYREFVIKEGGFGCRFEV